MRNSHARPYWIIGERWAQIPGTEHCLSSGNDITARARGQQTLITDSPFSQISKEILETGPLIFVWCYFLCSWWFQETSMCYKCLSCDRRELLDATWCSEEQASFLSLFHWNTMALSLPFLCFTLPVVYKLRWRRLLSMRPFLIPLHPSLLESSRSSNSVPPSLYQRR